MDAQVTRHQKRAGTYLTVVASDGTEVPGNTPDQLAKNWAKHEHGHGWADLPGTARTADIAERRRAIQDVLTPAAPTPDLTEEQSAILDRLRKSRAQVDKLQTRVDLLEEQLSDSRSELDKAKRKRWDEVESALREKIQHTVIMESSGIAKNTFYRHIKKQ